jgi:hypothetical protein
MSGNWTRAMPAPVHHASASIDRPFGSNTNRRYQSGSQAREVCSATLIFPARWVEYATINRLGNRYRWSRIDVAIAHSLLEQHSGVGGSTSGNRNDGAGRLVRVGWPFNCNSCLGLHWSDLCVSRWRFPEALGFFPAMKIDFTALTRPIPVPAMQPLCGAYLGFGIFLAAFHITSS